MPKLYGSFLTEAEKIYVRTQMFNFLDESSIYQNLFNKFNNEEWKFDKEQGIDHLIRVTDYILTRFESEKLISRHTFEEVWSSNGVIFIDKYCLASIITILKVGFLNNLYFYLWGDNSIKNLVESIINKTDFLLEKYVGKGVGDLFNRSEMKKYLWGKKLNKENNFPPIFISFGISEGQYEEFPYPLPNSYYILPKLVLYPWEQDGEELEKVLDKYIEKVKIVNTRLLEFFSELDN